MHAVCGVPAACGMLVGSTVLSECCAGWLGCCGTEATCPGCRSLWDGFPACSMPCTMRHPSHSAGWLTIRQKHIVPVHCSVDVVATAVPVQAGWPSGRSTASCSRSWGRGAAPTRRWEPAGEAEGGHVLRGGCRQHCRCVARLLLWALVSRWALNWRPGRGLEQASSEYAPPHSCTSTPPLLFPLQ